MVVTRLLSRNARLPREACRLGPWECACECEREWGCLWSSLASSWLCEWSQSTTCEGIIWCNTLEIPWMPKKPTTKQPIMTRPPRDSSQPSFWRYSLASRSILYSAEKICRTVGQYWWGHFRTRRPTRSCRQRTITPKLKLREHARKVLFPWMLKLFWPGKRRINKSRHTTHAPVTQAMAKESLC